MSEKTVKLIEGSLLPKGDYVSSGFSTIQPDSYFPKLYLGNMNLFGCQKCYYKRSL
ncbi:MAG: hypothetical protein RMZ43_015770 [Nostoc sp. CmiVER01]|uniref:hypothetical protein n=1 Tax=Nostoc sp. CmiVER01 TaxID=3075384 RepID=UPI002AD232FA|nr:hypothetical protein [Nostoc sp. CmiVER01]MDZ8122809.1 hypothetical protein [Nostoc sp. CmiVER01]